MQRSLIRFCGYILGIIGCFGTANAEQKQIEGTIYDDNTIYDVVSGFAVFQANSDVNKAFVDKYCPDGVAATGQRICEDIITGTGTGLPETVCYDLPNLATECSGKYFCNGTGVYCTREGFFKENGFNNGGYMGYTGTAWDMARGAYKLNFVKCDNAYYMSSTGGVCNTGVTTTNVNSLAACCSHCPSFVWNEINGGTTFPYGGTQCMSGWCIGSDGGVITTCYAYPENPKSYTDTAGTYEFVMTGSGCPYYN